MIRLLREIPSGGTNEGLIPLKKLKVVVTIASAHDAESSAGKENDFVESLGNFGGDEWGKDIGRKLAIDLFREDLGLIVSRRKSLNFPILRVLYDQTGFYRSAKVGNSSCALANTEFV